MSKGSVIFGRSGEEQSVSFLKKQGYKIICRNWKCALGEIDIVAREKDTLVFIEVKSRRNESLGSPELAVDHKKQHRLISLAQAYLKRYGIKNTPLRFDVVANSPKGTELIRSAFCAEGNALV